MNILWLSPIPVYDNVPHAGGKTWNYYLKQFSKRSDLSIKVIVFSKESEKRKIDFSDYGIDYEVIISKGNLLFNIRRIIVDGFGILIHGPALCSYYKRFAVRRVLRKLVHNNYKPDVIIAEWTEFVSLVNDYKKKFPNAKIVASEHDVNYVGLERKLKTGKQHFYFSMRKKKYSCLISEELEALRACDLIVPQSEEDLVRLIRKGFSVASLFLMTPFYMKMSLDTIWTGESKDILFYGAMNRPENYEAAIWFNDRVFSRLSDQDTRFIIMGGNPHEVLKEITNPKVLVTGYVDDISQYFSKCCCFVAPLQLGAGIKVKVLEAMAAGIPVIANHIAIEGINAVDGRDYVHAETDEDFFNAVNTILNEEIDVHTISNNASIFVRNVFNYEQCAMKYNEILQRLVSKEER
ncbi:MAG: glycosyltransferase [Aminipila sp.]